MYKELFKRIVEASQTESLTFFVVGEWSSQNINKKEPEE